eukprot:SAG31_NODE_6161_length_2143_cov_2.048434_3_plen_137_part_01
MPQVHAGSLVSICLILVVAPNGLAQENCADDVSELLNQNCCPDPECNGGFPLQCSQQCADVFNPFYKNCILTGEWQNLDPTVRQQMDQLHTTCMCTDDTGWRHNRNECEDFAAGAYWHERCWIATGVTDQREGEYVL